MTERKWTPGNWWASPHRPSQSTRGMIPRHIDIALREIGVIPPRHAQVHIPEPQSYVAWKPKYPGEEPPF